MAATAGPLGTTATPIVPNIAGTDTTPTAPLVTSSNIATVQVAALPARDATQNSRNLTLTIDGVHDFTTCSFANPFTSLACNLAGVSVIASQLPTLGNLVAQIGTTSSNSLPVTRYLLNQISNTSGSANLIWLTGLQSTIRNFTFVRIFLRQADQKLLSTIAPERVRFAI